jgi:mono/diheme cytochrome c family protein
MDDKTSCPVLSPLSWLLRRGRYVTATMLAAFEFARRVNVAQRALPCLSSVVLFLATWFATTPCANAHLRPVEPDSIFNQLPWPLPWQPSLAVLDDPGIRWHIAFSLIAAGVGITCAVTGSLWQGVRIPLLACGAALLLAAVPAMRLLLVPAYPTSLYRSPTHFDAASIMKGRALFAVNCVVCHGANGRGNGPSARQLPIPPADLTAAHLWSHSDGDLFWQT